MNDDDIPAPKKGRKTLTKSLDPISDFLNIPGEPDDLIPSVKGKGLPAPVENALYDNEEDSDIADLNYVKDIQKDILAKGMDMIEEAMSVARSTNDMDAHEVVVKYIKEISKANQGLLDLNRKHQSTQESKARMRKINKETLAKVETISDEESDQDYTITTTSADMLRMVKELEAEEAKKAKKKK